MDVVSVLRAALTRKLLLEAAVLFPLQHLRLRNLYELFGNITYDFQQFVDFECLREDHLEAQVRHLRMELRAALLHVVLDLRRLDLALPQRVVGWVLLCELAFDVFRNAGL